ncbi:MAG: hypothetical protein ABF619_07275 [Oenococcus oeni]
MKDPTHIVAVGAVVLNEDQEILLVKTFLEVGKSRVAKLKMVKI